MKDKEGKGKQRSTEEGLDQVATSRLISLLVLTFMVHPCVFLVLLLSLAWVLSSVTVFLNLSLPFMDNQCVTGFLLLG